MVKIQKETKIKTFRDNGVIIETIQQYHYETAKEKSDHKKIMEEKGFEDSGQVKENIGTIMQPNHVWFGSYFKVEEYRPDMREKVKEYIAELDEEIIRCETWIEKNMNIEACAVATMESRLQTLNEVKYDLESRLEELV